MTKDRIIALAGVFVLGIAVGMIFFGNRSTTPSPIGFETRQLDNETDKLIAHAEYPVTYRPSLDQRIADFVNGTIDDFTKQIDAEPLIGGRKNTISITFTATLLTSNYASFLFVVTKFPSGGAHPDAEIVGKNYLMATGEEITLATLFRPGSRYLERISDAAAKDLSAALGPALFKDAISPAAKNFQSFTFARDAIIFHFSPATVAPYVYGPQTVVIPLGDLQDILQ